MAHRENRYTAHRADLERITREHAAEIRRLGKEVGELREQMREQGDNYQTLLAAHKALKDEHHAPTTPQEVAA